MFYVKNEDGLVEIVSLLEGQEAPEGVKVFDTIEEASKASDEMNETESEQVSEVDKAQAEAEKELEAFEKENPVIVKKLYEYRDIWAEEGSSLKSNTAQWSFGNGATGYMGLPVDAGWQVEAIYFMASTYASTAKVQVDLMDYSGPTPGSAASRAITSISLEDARDGGGDTNNAYKYEVLDTPVNVIGDVTVLGFITREAAGSIGNSRVGVRLRREL